MKRLLKKMPGAISLYLLLKNIYGQVGTKRNVLLKLWFNLWEQLDPPTKKMVDIGGGGRVYKGWQILDFYSTDYKHLDLFVDYNFDLTSDKPLPFKKNSVDYFYSSHTLEHIPQKYCQHILDEIFRCLKKNGAVRITVPDFDLIYGAYGRRDRQFFKGYPFQSQTKNLMKAFATYLVDKVKDKEVRKNYQSMTKTQFANFYLKQVPLSSQKDNPSFHINWWNFDKFQRMLVKAGFSKEKIYPSQPQQSKFPDMRGKGLNGFDVRHPEISVFVEAIK